MAEYGIHLDLIQALGIDPVQVPVKRVEIVADASEVVSARVDLYVEGSAQRRIIEIIRNAEKRTQSEIEE